MNVGYCIYSAVVVGVKVLEGKIGIILEEIQGARQCFLKGWDESAFPAFRAFCLAHADELDPMLRSGRTQTCVVHRSAIMLPAIGTLPRVAQADGRVGLLEIGPAIGLNLRLDHYRFVYEGEGATLTWGAEDATPRLACGGRRALRRSLTVPAR